MSRIDLMQSVRSVQVGTMSRREFLVKATAALGSMTAASTLLAACAPPPAEEPPPVVDSSQPTAVPGVESDEGGLTTAIVTYPGPQEASLLGYLAHQPGKTAAPAVIVIQEWWGLNDHIKDVTRRFASEGFVSLAPDLYNGVVTTEPDEARKLAMELSMGDAVAEIQAAVTYLQGLENVSQGIGVVGFCMGGGLVLQTAVADSRIGAGVAFYGTPLGAAEAGNVSAPILSFLGTADRIPLSSLEAMHAALDQAGVENVFQIYEGAQHAFFNDTRASYDPEAAADAWDQTLAWFNKHLSA